MNVNKSALAWSLIFIGFFFNLFPPLFYDGGIFATKGLYKDLSGDVILIDGFYYDKVFWICLYFLLSYVFFILPIILPTVGKKFNRVSMILAAWFTSAFIFALVNLAIPDIILEYFADRNLFTKFVLTVMIGVVLILIREPWIKEKKLNV